MKSIVKIGQWINKGKGKKVRKKVKAEKKNHRSSKEEGIKVKKSKIR